MDLQFHKTSCQCLKKILSQVQSREETLELRLSDTMADIGRVLGCWGQVLIRGKEWRGDSISVSGGVKAWVMYEPEDKSEPGSMEAWIPFQMKWDIPKVQRDGTIQVWPVLRGIDARSVSARKMMLRCNVSLLGEALEPVEADTYEPDSVPEDVQLLVNTYPAELPQEAGEKLVQIEEELLMPDSMPKLQRILRAEAVPEVSEHKVMAGRLVFRGKCRIHMLYLAENGGLSSWDAEQAFSQYTELDKDYGGNATALLLPIVTTLDLEPMEGQKLGLKCGMAVQYVICDQVMLKMVEDAYSPQRTVAPQLAELEFPMRLDSVAEVLETTANGPTETQKVVDVAWNGNHPDKHYLDDKLELAVSGQFQVLYYDGDGELQCDSISSDSALAYSSDMQNRADTYLRLVSRPQIMQNGGEMLLSSRYALEMAFYSQEPISGVIGLQMGELQEPNPERPSLVIRRVDDGGLWKLAKTNGSTVTAIQSANRLQAEPEIGQLLLIPVS